MSSVLSLGEGIRRDDISRPRTSTTNKLDKEEHWQEGFERKMSHVWGARRIYFPLTGVMYECKKTGSTRL